MTDCHDAAAAIRAHAEELIGRGHEVLADLTEIATELRTTANRLEPPGPPPRPNHLKPRAAGFQYKGHPPR